MSVNGSEVLNVPHEQTIKHLQSNPKTVDIVVSREVATPHAPEEVTVEIAFKKGVNGSLGFSIAGGTDDAIEVHVMYHGCCELIGVAGRRSKHLHHQDH